MKNHIKQEGMWWKWIESCDRCVRNTEPNEEIYKQILAMREEATPSIKPEPRKKRIENAE